jgi:hypothetical protein
VSSITTTSTIRREGILKPHQHTATSRPLHTPSAFLSDESLNLLQHHRNNIFILHFLSSLILTKDDTRRVGKVFDIGKKEEERIFFWPNIAS